MPLDIDNGLPAMHMIFGTYNKNEAKFCTNVDACAGMNVGNLKLHQCIITKNPYIVESYIHFEDVNPFDPILLNCDLDKGNKFKKKTLTSLVTCIIR